MPLPESVPFPCNPATSAVRTGPVREDGAQGPQAPHISTLSVPRLLNLPARPPQFPSRRTPHVPASLDVLPTGHVFAAYARTHWSRLVATARLLTDDPGAAEELALRTLVRMCARWRRVPRNDVDFHVRRCLVRGHLHRLRGR